MNPLTQIFQSFIQETATKGADLVVGVSRHTGVFVSFYDIGHTMTTILSGLFK